MKRFRTIGVWLVAPVIILFSAFPVGLAEEAKPVNLDITWNDGERNLCALLPLLVIAFISSRKPLNKLDAQYRPQLLS
jgi:hypothetical protein